MEYRLKMRSSYTTTKLLQDNTLLINNADTPPSSTNTSPAKSFTNHSSTMKITSVASQVDFMTGGGSDLENDDNTGNINNGNNIDDEKKKLNGSTYSSSTLVRPLGSPYSERFRKDKCKPVEIMECPECKKNYKNAPALTKHMIKKHKKINKVSEKKSNFKCKDCNQTYTSKLGLKQHYKIHSDSMNCPQCNENFDCLGDFDWHVAMCNGKMRAEIDKIENIGRRKTRSQSGIRTLRHIDDGASSISGHDSVYTARQEFVKRYVRNRKEMTQIMPEPDISNIDYDQVSVCNSAYTNFTSVSCRSTRKKKKFSNDLFEFNCFMCPKFFTTLPDIMKHETVMHFMQPRYRCNDCLFYFTHLEYLEIHERCHRLNLRCHLCTKVFQTRLEHREHIRQHTIKSYKCSVCPISFTTSAQLCRHRKENNHAIIKKSIKSLIEIRKNYHKRSAFGLIHQKLYYKTNKYQSFEMLQSNSFPIVGNPVKAPFKCRIYNGVFEQPPPKKQEILIHGNTIEEILEHIRSNPEYSKYFKESQILSLLQESNKFENFEPPEEVAEVSAIIEDLFSGNSDNVLFSHDRDNDDDDDNFTNVSDETRITDPISLQSVSFGKI